MFSALTKSIQSTMNRKQGLDETTELMAFSTAAIIAAIIYVVLILLFGKLLWNQVLVKLIPTINKATSIWQILGISILFALLMPK
jgi:hypothetical protein